MSPEEYSVICDRILTETMKYITTANMRRCVIDKSYIDSKNPIYLSAVTSGMPITIVYAPAGSGKADLIADRVKGLVASGVNPKRIGVLSMNIIQAKRMTDRMPDVQSLTFNDFIHRFVEVNYPNLKLVPTQSLTSLLKLRPHDQVTSDLITRMDINNSQDRMCLLTSYVNRHLQDVFNLLNSIGRIDHTMESMLLQNIMYYIERDPFCFEEILIDGCHNMPIPILCAVLEYASMVGCRLFITGMPNETIYEFNMAYGNAMNVLSGYQGKQDISIVRMESTKLSPNIHYALNMVDNAYVQSNHVCTASCVVRVSDDPAPCLAQMLSPQQGYVADKLANHKQLLFVARSKNDLADLKRIFLGIYGQAYPQLNIIDLTEIQAPDPLWNTILVKYKAGWLNTYPDGVTLPDMLNLLYGAIENDLHTEASSYMRERLTQSKDLLMTLVNRQWTTEDGMKMPLLVRINQVIEMEAAMSNAYTDNVKAANIDLEHADVIFSTVFSAVDIRCDNVVSYFHNFTPNVDENLYRIALSRANDTEYLLFVNTDNFEVPLQRYLNTHTQIH